MTSEGIPSRLASRPSWELFKKQTRNTAIPSYHLTCMRASQLRAAIRLVCRQYLGSEGRVVARYDFGASAPIKDLSTHFGFTAAHVASEARSLIKR
ncbi:MAG: transketolase-like TK C-terminal-containing protein [Acidobacteriaceae bacterium]